MIRAFAVFEPPQHCSSVRLRNSRFSGTAVRRSGDRLESKAVTGQTRWYTDEHSRSSCLKTTIEEGSFACHCRCWRSQRSGGHSETPPRQTLRRQMTAEKNCYRRPGSTRRAEKPGGLGSLRRPRLIAQSGINAVPSARRLCYLDAAVPPLSATSQDSRFRLGPLHHRRRSRFRPRSRFLRKLET
jgi:hypothetical protein